MSEKIGRFEYVKRGFVGACAATMLAGMCAVPAFAAEPIDKEIAVQLDTTAINQISVTVPTGPLKAVVTQNVDDKTKADVSIADVFNIQNDSLVSLKVTNLKVATDSTLAGKLSLVGSNAYDASTADNVLSMIATTPSAASGNTTIDFADCTQDAGKAISDVKTITAGTAANISMTAKMKNFTGDVLQASAFPLLTATWTVSVA